MKRFFPNFAYLSVFMIELVMRKITVITGASSGLGAEFARQLFELYENTLKPAPREIWLIARSAENLNQTAEKIQSSCKNPPTENSVQIKTFALNLAGTAGAGDFAALLQNEQKNGNFQIECLINNAGFGTYGPFDETPAEKEMLMIDLNCTALTGICGHALKYLTSGSKIINVSSLAAFMPLGNFAVYAATKAYVLSFSLALAAELRPKGIFVSALCPGSVSTNFANVASNGKRKEVLHGKDPVKVVRHCLKKAFKGKKIILTFAKWKFLAFASRFAGKYAIASLTYRFAKRPH